MRHSNLTNLNKIQKKKKESIEGSSSHIIGDEFNVNGENRPNLQTKSGQMA